MRSTIRNPVECKHITKYRYCVIAWKLEMVRDKIYKIVLFTNTKSVTLNDLKRHNDSRRAPSLR